MLGKKKKKENHPNLMKLLFLPLDATYLTLSPEEWDTLRANELRVLDDKGALPTRDLRTACRQRRLAPNGPRRELVGKLLLSLNDQFEQEAAHRAAELAKLQAALRAQGGCFAWGYGKSGQLGVGKRMTTSQPQHVQALAKDRVVKVFAGADGDTCFALTENDQVYVWGSRRGATGQKDWTADAPGGDPLDIVTDEMELEFEAPSYEDGARDEAAFHEGDLLLPRRIERLCGEKVAAVAPGRRSAVARTRDGDVYAWGHNHFGQLGPLMVHSDAIEEDEVAVRPSTQYADTALPMLAQTGVDSHARSVGMCADGSLVSLQNGQICVWGNPKGNANEHLIRQALSDIRVKQVACGAAHSCAVDTRGRLYTWGGGDGFRLGHGDCKPRHVPTRVAALDDRTVIEVQAGVWHSAAVVMVPPMRQGGWVYTWGAGFHGQLGQESEKFSPIPKPIHDFIEDGVYTRHISCGRYHTAIVTTTGKCYTWGSNRYGCLGRREELMGLASSYTPVPGMVDYFSQPFLGKVVSACAGRHFTACVLAPYDGPGERELDDLRRARRRRRDGVRRVQRILKRLEEAEKWRMALERRAAIVQFLNEGQHSGCAFCDTPYDCPGFQPDFFVPTVCKHCEHERDYHTELRRVEDKDLTNEMLDEYDRIIRENLPEEDDEEEEDNGGVEDQLYLEG